MMAFVLERKAELLARIAEHLTLSGIAVALGAVAGVLIALLAFRRPALRGGIMTVLGVIQTIPGMALLVVLMTALGRIGAVPALGALVLYALLPVARNTLTGLLSTPPELVEAARGLGLTRPQQLFWLRLPLALPPLMAGLRIAAVQTVGLATLAAFIGAGGLGQFINRGLFLSDARLILLGAVPAAVIALLVDGMLALWEISLTRDRSALARRLSCGAGCVLLVTMMLFTLRYHQGMQAEQPVVIGGKSFTEQLVLVELIAQVLEREGYPVIRKPGLGGSAVVHQALLAGEVDVAVEYTGTALAAILHTSPPAHKGEAFQTVQNAYREQFGLEVLTPLGFNNTYVLAMRASDAEARGIRTISDLAGQSRTLKAGFDFEFAERDDGYKGLRQTYGLRFRQVRDLHPDLLYGILDNRGVDVISAAATDGRMTAYSLRLLEDDKGFFPPYEAAIVVRADLLEGQPELRAVLESLSGMLDDAAMRALNAEVDLNGITPKQAAAAFLSAAGASRP